MGFDFDVQALLTPPDVMKCKRVLCVQPHPDDNEIGMGGIVSVLVKNGCDVRYLTVTNGDRGNNDKSATVEETAAARREETQAAGRYLGVRDFYFLDHGDGTLSDVVGLSKEIAAVIRRVKPEAVFCPDPWLNYESHLDHVVTGLAVSNALMMTKLTLLELPGGHEPWQVDAVGYYFTANPNTVIDITGEFETKFAAVCLHKSQIDAQTLALYKVYFTMKGEELAQGRGFKLGEGLKFLGKLHTHCFVDAYKL